MTKTSGLQNCKNILLNVRKNKSIENVQIVEWANLIEIVDRSKTINAWCVRVTILKL